MDTDDRDALRLPRGALYNSLQMSLITRCPACQTLFKVVPDQLRISEGWVRCGQCDEIFEASLHLLQAAPEMEMSAFRSEAPVANYDLTDASDAIPQPVAIDLNSDRQGSPDELPLEQKQALPDERADVTHADFDGPEPERGAELSDVSFLRDKRAGSFWHKPLLRATLVLLSLALLLGLAGQIVFHERDRIVASQPGLKPWLLALCGHLNCTLSPLRRIEFIVLDSASFSKIRGDSYHLNFTLKNTATTALAVPAIELTLTDALDQPAMRRVFFPTELGVQLDTLAAGSEWPMSLAIAVNAGDTVARVAGYRLLAFYP